MSDETGIRSQERRIDRSTGGPLGRWYDEISGNTYECPLCLTPIRIEAETAVRGHPHPKGLEDEDGTSVYPHVICPNCEFEVTYELFTERRI